MKILSFGEILWDVYPGQKHIGGASFNFAAHLAGFVVSDFEAVPNYNIEDFG